MSTTATMTKIGAWIRDPANNFFKGMSKRSGLYVLLCSDPDACDLYKNEKTCLHCGAMSPCRFGRKIGTEGPTRNSSKFHSTLNQWREANKDVLNALGTLKAYNRIFRAQGHYYLPYAFMAKGWHDYAPLESKWVAEADMTTELLEKICTARPRAMMGGEIADYQKKQIPKFISDLKMHYPDVFALLPADQKARFETISHVGRRADITTCTPAEFVISGNRWKWDGKTLIGSTMLFQPVAGDCEIRIIPKPGQSVEITNDNQVSEDTRFLD